MLFKRFYDDDLAQASYLIGCQQTGEALVVDPRRDVRCYLDEVRAQKMTLKAVTETHIHADYLSGSRELAAVTGAPLYLSDEGGSSWQYRFPHRGLRHGERLEFGKLVLEARHTPGHTPEHLSFRLTDGAATTQPGFLLTGDFVFVGDVGRPDLLDDSGHGADTRERMARGLFRSLRDEFLTLPDFIQVWPGHGAGSACGRSLGAVASSTVGYERLVAWWATYAEGGDEAGFVEALLAGQPDMPAYFSRMKRLNREGPPLLGKRPALQHLSAAKLERSDELRLIDTRSRAAYERDAVVGALHLPAGKTFATYAAYILEPEREGRNFVVLASDEAHAAALRNQLARVGVDNVVGYLTSLEGLKRHAVATVSPGALGTLEHPFILDVRTESEYEAGHLPGARQLHAGQVMEKLGELPRDRPLVTYCQSGARSTVVSSALRAAGFDNVVELEGSYAGWEEAQKEGSAL